MPLNRSENGTTISEKTSNNVIFSRKNKLSCNIRLVSPYPITHRFKPDTEFVGKSLVEMMSAKFPFQPQEEWERRVRMGRVSVNDETVTPKFLLSNFDEISHHNPRVVEPSVPDDVEVLEETEDYLIVFKPAPIPMHPGGRYFKNTLIEILKDQGFEDLRVTHRLDAVTSGIVLLAKNKSFAKKAMRCFAEGRVSKTYIALVDGIPNEKATTINTPIRRKKGFVFECGEHLEGAKPAITHFEVIEERGDSSIIKCIPETGRTHQIRLHLAHWGHPIVDDLIYGKDGDQSSKTTQKRAISLVSVGLEIEELGINYKFKITSDNF